MVKMDFFGKNVLIGYYALEHHQLRSNKFGTKSGPNSVPASCFLSSSGQFKHFQTWVYQQVFDPETFSTSGVPRAKMTRENPFFRLLVSFTSGVHQHVWHIATGTRDNMITINEGGEHDLFELNIFHLVKAHHGMECEKHTERGLNLTLTVCLPFRDPLISSNTSRSNSGPGSHHLIYQPLSSPCCWRHMPKGQMTRQISVSGLWTLLCPNGVLRIHTRDVVPLNYQGCAQAAKYQVRCKSLFCGCFFSL